MTGDVNQLHRDTGHKPPAHPIIAAAIFVLTIVLAVAAAASEVSRAALAPLRRLASADHGVASADAVIAFVRSAFDTAGFRPRWQTETWASAHAWVHIAADLVISASYGALGAALWHVYRLRRGGPFSRLFWLFAIFFIAGGATHLLDCLMFWWPAYRLTTLVLTGAALLSLAMALAFVPAAPKLASLRSSVEIQREIAQRRKTELEMRRIHAELEGVIEQRTAELAQKNEEMEQFLNTVSHDLKSPVVTCLGLTGMLREDVKAGRVDESVDSIDRIERSATRMRQLIEDLLNLSRIGKVRFELVDVDADTLLHSIGDEFKPRFEKLGAAFDIETKLPHVLADARWMTEVFENLITNAMKYGCDNPQPRITVGCVSTEKEHQFYVRDNGNGIDPAHHAQILEPFRRLRTDKEGSGMGLAIVVRIVRMHGGRIWIESKPGQGATFWISLPIRDLTPSAATVGESEPQNQQASRKGVLNAA
jgi:chemotaxis family two-component system sensor kinase Cph1